MDGNAKGHSLAGYGVTIFFTLSGFLITYLLLKEKEFSGRVKIKDFYIRRALRIWPLYYLYLSICLITILAFGLQFIPSSIPFYIFLAANIPFILGKTLPFLAHYWSLGVEEQFYVFFPHLAKLPNKKLFYVSLLMIITLLLLKAIFWILDRKYQVHIPFVAISVTRFHNMLVGVAGAILYYWGNRIFLRISTHILTQALSWLCIALLIVNKFHIASVIDGEIISMVALFLIMGQITKKNNILNLENKLFDLIGKISYGIYVIHPIIIFFTAQLIGRLEDKVANYLIVYSIITALTILLAYLSYEYYEKLFLKLKNKYTTIRSASTSSYDTKSIATQ